MTLFDLVDRALDFDIVRRTVTINLTNPVVAAKFDASRWAIHFTASGTQGVVLEYGLTQSTGANYSMVAPAVLRFDFLHDGIAVQQQWFAQASAGPQLVLGVTEILWRPKPPAVNISDIERIIEEIPLR